MNKSDIIATVHTVLGGKLTDKGSETAVNTVLQSIANGLSRGEEVSINGFGIFKIKEVAERKGRNLQTGEPLTIPAHKKIAFKPWKGAIEGVK